MAGTHELPSESTSQSHRPHILSADSAFFALPRRLIGRSEPTEQVISLDQYLQEHPITPVDDSAQARTLRVSSSPFVEARVG